MLFSSYTFIFMFLPFVLIVFILLQKASFKNHLIIAKVFLILSSLFFYAYWKLEYLPILLISIVINYIIARQILISGYNHLSLNNTYNINNINTNKIDSINNMDNNINHNNTNNIYGGGG